MRSTIIRKTVSKLSFSIAISFLLGEVLLKSRVFFIFSASFFGALYLLLGWIQYLSLDGIGFFKNLSNKFLKKQFNILDRFSYKNRGVYNIDNDPISENIDLEDDELTKASMYSYFLCGILLLIISHMVFTP